MRPWRQPHNQYARIGIAEARHRFAPIFPVFISPPLLTRDLLAIHNQPGALHAGDNFRIENSEPVRHFRVRFPSRPFASFVFNTFLKSITAKDTKIRRTIKKIITTKDARVHEGDPTDSILRRHRKISTARLDLVAIFRLDQHFAESSVVHRVRGHVADVVLAAQLFRDLIKCLL